MNRIAVGVAVVAFVAGAGTGALALSRTLSGDSVRTQAVIRDGTETFTVDDAAFDRQAIDIPGYRVDFQVSSPTWYRLSAYALGATVLTDATGCDTPPPIGTRITPRLFLKTPTGTVTPAIDRAAPLTATGSYTLAAKLAGNQSGLGAYDCDALTFTTEPGWFFLERFPLSS